MCLHPNTIIENAICNIVADITLKELPSSNKHLPDSPFITLFTVKRYCQHSGKATMRDYERSLQEQVDQMTSFWHKASQTTNQPTPLAVFFSSLHLVWNQVQKQIRIKPIQCSVFFNACRINSFRFSRTPVFCVFRRGNPELSFDWPFLKWNALTAEDELLPGGR